MIDMLRCPKYEEFVNRDSWSTVISLFSSEYLRRNLPRNSKTNTKSINPPLNTAIQMIWLIDNSIYLINFGSPEEISDFTMSPSLFCLYFIFNKFIATGLILVDE